MNCQEAQGLITQYINGQLEGKKLEDFLLHIKNCSSCQEELEVYYIVINGIKRMDQDDDIAINYHEAFLNAIKESEEGIRWKKMHHSSQRIVLFLVVVFICYSLNLSVGKYDIDHTISYRLEGESEYKLKPYFFNGRSTELETYAIFHFKAYRDSLKRAEQGEDEVKVDEIILPTFIPAVIPTVSPIEQLPTSTPKAAKKKKKTSTIKATESINKSKNVK